MDDVATIEAQRDALVERLFDSTPGAMDLLTVYVRDRLYGGSTG